MPSSDWTRIISAGVGPIIVISACGLLCLAFYNRLAAVVTRLRSFHRDQLQEQETLARLRTGGSPNEAELVRRQEVLGMLQVQIGKIQRRAGWIRRTLACLLYTIICLAACSLALGLSVIWPGLIYAAVPLFIIGLVLLIAAVICALVELEHALDPVALESQFMTNLARDYEDAVG
ncbi:MAG TPA: DUF2721 domain-containing protein [Humisphaera sp.]|jgi:biotin transporter BioY|nr:DUF2721 domain-containing protein [Humisphaera sp.]